MAHIIDHHSIFFDYFFLTYLIRQDDDGIAAGDTGDSGVEVVTAGGQDGAVGPKALVFHHHGHITQDVPLPLLIQAFQHVGTVHRRLKGEHWGGGTEELKTDLFCHMQTI